MTNEEHEGRLVARLQANKLLQRKDYTVSRDPAGIIIDRDGHVKGIWQYRRHAFEWTPAGYNEPTLAVKTLAEAEAMTLRELKIR